MPNPLKPEVLRSLARMGAQARLELLDMERRAILQLFPDLASPARGRRPGRPPKAQAAAAAPAAQPKRRRRRGTMNAAQRAEVSARMKRYWAEWRKKKGKK